MKAKLRILLILITLPFLQSCGAKFAYNFLDWYMEWKISSYVTLKGEQKKQSKKIIDEFHAWHRETQIPLYRNYLLNLQTRLEDGPMTGREVHDETDKIQDLMDLSLEKLLPDAIDILSQLNDKQAKQLLTTFITKRDKYTEKFIGPDPLKLHKRRIKELRNELKPWIGRLTEEQSEWVEQWSSQLKPYSELFITQQIRWEESLQYYLDNRHEKAKLNKGVRQLMFYRKDNWEEKLQEAVDYNQDISYELLAKILNHLNEKQRQKLDKKISGYIKSLDSIIKASRQSASPNLRPTKTPLIIGALSYYSKNTLKTLITQSLTQPSPALHV